MNYDRILKWNDDNMMCSTCVGAGENDICRSWLDELKKYDAEKCLCYVNDDQLCGLIGEAIERYGKELNLWICKNLNPCSGCLASSAHTLMSPREGCYDPEPFRGTKGDKQTWPGINGETHKEALEEIAAKENPTAEDCSEVGDLKNICLTRVASPGSICLTCPGGAPHNYIETGKICYKPEPWIIKRDRSDTEYNDKRQEIKEGGVEYVISKSFNLDDISKSDISGSVFKKMYQVTDPSHFFEAGTNTQEEWKHTPIEHELLQLGFIEAKVSDPVVKIGDTFLHEDGSLYFVQKHDSNRAILVSPMREGWYLYPQKVEGLTLKKLTHNGTYSQDKYFTPCNVEIRKVE